MTGWPKSMSILKSSLASFVGAGLLIILGLVNPAVATAQQVEEPPDQIVRAVAGTVGPQGSVRVGAFYAWINYKKPLGYFWVHKTCNVNDKAMGGNFQPAVTNRIASVNMFNNTGCLVQLWDRPNFTGSHTSYFNECPNVGKEICVGNANLYRRAESWIVDG